MLSYVPIYISLKPVPLVSGFPSYGRLDRLWSVYEASRNWFQESHKEIELKYLESDFKNFHPRQRSRRGLFSSLLPRGS